MRIISREVNTQHRTKEQDVATYVDFKLGHRKLLTKRFDGIKFSNHTFNLLDLFTLFLFLNFIWFLLLFFVVFDCFFGGGDRSAGVCLFYFVLFFLFLFIFGFFVLCVCVFCLFCFWY